MDNYQKQALQTRAGTETPYEDAKHAGFGLMTEVGEILDTYKRHIFYKTPLDIKNIIEETGDVLWYLSVGYYAVKGEMPKNAPDVLNYTTEIEVDTLLAKLVHHAANFFSVIMLYKSNWEEEQLDYDLDRIYALLAYFIKQELNITIEDVAKSNLEKLSKRYPNKSFSIEAAINRDKENELSHITQPITAVELNDPTN